MERAEISEFGCPTVSSQHVELTSLMLHELKLMGVEKGQIWSLNTIPTEEKTSLCW